MTKYSKFNIVYRLQKWLDSVPGQTFMNYAYSWGASIVILGALFKLTHLPGANFWLFLGMGTEVFVFFIAGFDRPFDKTEDGKEIPTHVGGALGGVVELAEGAVNHDILQGEGPTQLVEGEDYPEGADHGSNSAGATVVLGGGVIGGGGPTVIAGGGGTVVAGGTGGGVVGSGPVFVGGGGSQLTAGQEGLEGQAIVGGAPMELPEINPDMEEATNNYVDELKKLTETLQKVSEQSERLTRDSEEMENLNRTLTGISKVYEMQLKGASQQIGTIDEINEQTKKLAEQIAELNRIYARMIEAMTTNMPPRPATPTSPLS